MKIAIVRLTALGDLVLVEPAIRALRAKYSSAEVHLITEARYAELARACFPVDAVIGYDRHGEDRGLRGMTRVLERLPAQRYDLAIDLQGKPRTRVLLRRIDALERRVLSKRTLIQGVRALLGDDPPVDDRHASELYLEAIGLSGPVEPRLKRPPALFAERGLIGFAPGATHATKRWPIERFAALAERLKERIVLLGGPSDRDLLAPLRASGRFEAIDTTELDPLGLARAIASLELLVSVDTGPAHLAAAFEIPVVAIFGPTSTTRWAPRGPQHRLVTLGLDCAPCSNFGGAECPRPDRAHACMRELEVDRVLAEIRSIRSAP